MHLGRFLHFSQKVVGVTLSWLVLLVSVVCKFALDHEGEVIGISSLWPYHWKMLRATEIRLPR